MKFKRKEPRQVSFSFLEEPAFLHSISAAAVTAIEKKFPHDIQTGRCLDSDGYMAGLIEAIVRDADGKPALTAPQILTELDNEYFWELWEQAATYTGIKRSGREKVLQGLWDLAQRYFMTKSKDEHAGEFWQIAQAYVEGSERKN